MSDTDPAVRRLPGPPAVADLAAVSASIDPAPAQTSPQASEEPASAASVAPTLTPTSPTPPPGPAIVRPTEDVARADEAPRVPGAVAAGYGRLPTAPVATTLQGPIEGQVAEWEPAEPRRPRPVAAPWALGLAIVALAASLLVGWMLPLGLAAVIVGIVALRRPAEPRGAAVWAIVLGAVAVLYSAGWLLWAAWRMGLVG